MGTHNAAEGFGPRAGSKQKRPKSKTSQINRAEDGDIILLRFLEPRSQAELRPR